MTEQEERAWNRKHDDLKAIQDTLKTIAWAQFISDLPEPLCNIKSGLRHIRRWAQLWLKDMECEQ